MKHVEGKLNLLADYLSRWHVGSRYRQQIMELTKDHLLHEQVVDFLSIQFNSLHNSAMLQEI